MLAIAVDLLAGRYAATSFDDRNEVEWPPHPARLFYALMAAWADADAPSHSERAALAWLEAQPPPSISCDPDPSRRAVVTHFVPVNDPSAARQVDRAYATLVAADAASGPKGAAARDQARAKAVADSAKAAGASVGSTAVLPWERGLQPRTFPVAIPADQSVVFTWPDAAPEGGMVDTLDGLLGRVGRLGHSSTLVSCRVIDDPPASVLVPNDEGALALRVPRIGLADRLESAHRAHGGVEPRSLPAGTARYSSPTSVGSTPLLSSLAGPIRVLALPTWAVVRLPRTLDLTRAVRGAVLRHADQPVQEILSGHCADAETGASIPSSHPHLAVVPLANAGHPRSDGRIHGVGLVLPTAATDADIAALDAAIARWSAAGFELGVHVGGESPLRGAAVVLQDATAMARQLASIRPTALTRPGRAWSTVTPIALDGFVDHLFDGTAAQRARADVEAGEQIARSARRVGLPGPSVVRVRVDGPMAGIPACGIGPRRAAGRFPALRTGSGALRLCVHADVLFDEPIRGPLLLGAGRHRGYGLLLSLPGDALPSLGALDA